FWRQDNRPIQLFSAAVFEQKLNYLHNNPVEAGLVELAEEYIYSSAPAIAGRLGLLALEPL
ncbi:MAG: transposase, partial [Bacteroidetes bacterium]|nr:transposase [Bacteroidota bacterium]